MDLYMDEKWKPPKKGAMSRSNSCSTSRRAAMAEGCASGAPFLKASASMREGRESPTDGPRSFSRRCANLVKEQRAKFYIMRRCVTMLMCWKDLP